MENLYGNMILIEGLISAGKSTLTKELVNKIPNAISFEEQTINSDLLAKFYADPKKYSFLFQMETLCSRYSQHIDGIKQAWTNKKITVFDRSIYADSCFVEVLRNADMMSDLEYDTYFKLKEQMFKSLLIPQLCIALDVSPEIALERIAQRGRECEKGITLDYLTNLKNEYEKVYTWLSDNDCTVVRIDYNDYDKGKEEIYSCLSRLSFIK